MAAIKNILRTWIHRSARSRLLYTWLWHPVGRFVQLAKREYEWQQYDLGPDWENAQKELAAELIVRAGPFVGMRYPAAGAVGSAFTAKLLGCYEQELHEIVYAAVNRDYDTVIDIGCAEGYYAVGLARALPHATIKAYDTLPAARRWCEAMADANGVTGRVQVLGHCGCHDLLSLTARRALILSDCEGYEAALFDRKTAAALARHDVLIESHDFIHPYLQRCLRVAFSGTHDVTVIRSVADPVRPTIFPQPPISKYRPDVQIAMMAEYRPADMVWLWCKSREAIH